MIPPAEFTCVHYALEDHIARITLNRPERRNALNRRAYAEVEAAFRHAAVDGEVRCVIVTGADPAFCSGEDVKEMMTGEVREAPATPLRYEPTPAAMAVLECDKPVIAAVNGAAVGWGMELALYADIRIASQRAAFAELFIKRGLVCDVGGLTRLSAIVGPAKAAELLFTGDPIDAAEALRIGLVSQVTGHDDLMPAAQGLAQRIAANAPLALVAMKQGLRRATHDRDREIGAWAIETIHRLFATEDHREGVRSFLEKRAPVFVGR
jgi:enoyl-CoA hydratase/carnithine racemase